jgi:hypothetical protein
MNLHKLHAVRGIDVRNDHQLIFQGASSVDRNDMIILQGKEKNI